MKIKIIPALNDNYIFLITCEETGTTAVIDASEASPVIKALGNNKLDYILTTHHHYDHIGGNLELKQRYNCKIIAGSYDVEHNRVPSADRGVCAGNTFKIGNINVEVVDVPGHTLGHIAYYLPNEGALFSGDVIFSAGCGGVFEGTTEMMFNSLQKLKQLPVDTKIYCAHEYTVHCLVSALDRYPENEEIKKHLAWARELRKKGKPTLPTTFTQEFKSNIYLMADNLQDFSNI